MLVEDRVQTGVLPIDWPTEWERFDAGELFGGLVKDFADLLRARAEDAIDDVDLIRVDAELAAAASLLARCDFSVGNDSGFSHLAAAMNCPVISLFGPTDPLVWKPAGGHVEVVSSGFPAPIDQIAVDHVFRKAASLLARETVPNC